uniref:Uncharacterized protein n=1 Tax=Anopheles maculatus TaxID=74869 RepID=A0A182SSB6_9DIPT
MGYDLARFQGDVDEELICPICSGVLEEPLQVSNRTSGAGVCGLTFSHGGICILLNLLVFWFCCVAVFRSHSSQTQRLMVGRFTEGKVNAIFGNFLLAVDRWM